jgi:hypothetical protein
MTAERVKAMLPIPKFHGKINGLAFTVSHLWLEPTDRYHGSRRIYRLVKPFHITMKSEGCYLDTLVPIGFESDFATFPLVVQLILGGNDAVGTCEAAIIHDYACVNRLPSSVANALMLAVLTVFGVPKWRRALIFIGLSVFGYRTPLLKLAQFIRRLVWRKK